MELRRNSPSILGLAVLLVGLGCAHRDWRRALDEDSAGAYHRFLREHPDSGYAQEARARLAFVQIRTHPTREGYRDFVETFQGSPLAVELRPVVEAAFFEQARASGTAEAYEGFLKDFGEGAFADRARGNAEYLRNHGFEDDPSALAAFAVRCPASDFAPEAERSVASLRLREMSAFRRVGLVIDVDSTTPGTERLQRAFAERAVSAYRSVGLDLVPVPATSDPALRSAAALLVIKHRERAEQSRFERGTVSESSVVAETDVTLETVDGQLPVWHDTFTYRAPLSAKSADESILFGPGATSYWLQFFVPVATWQTSAATRDARDLLEPVKAVDAQDGRAIVLFGDGGFKVFDLADPSHPVVVADYRRARDLKRFDGIALLGSRAAVYGPDGLEVVRLGDAGPAREQVWGRDQVGSLVAVVEAGDGLALAGNRGLLWIGAEQQAPRTYVSRPIRGLARAGAHLLFTDGASLYSATPTQLSQGRVASELRLGRGFDSQRVRVQGSRAIVIGARSLMNFDVSDPALPLLRSRIEMNQVGEVRDAVFYSGRTFLLGDRGLQVTDESGQRIVESVDVSARQHLGAGGRHLVLIGDRSLQVVDATPFVTSAPAAALEVRK